MILDPKGNVVMPGIFLPGFRSSLAIQRGVERNLLIKTWGGVGDELCAEPTLRYALDVFGKDCDISLASERPEFFEHLEFKKVYHLGKEKPNWDDYFVFDTIYPVQHIQWQFMSHMLVNCVDYPSLCAFRGMLPISYKQIRLHPKNPNDPFFDNLVNHRDKYVVVHPGKHWESKSFPVDWWDAAIDSIKDNGFTPILIGKDIDENQGTMAVNPDGCVDLRNETTIMETAWLLQKMPILISNDSSPIHIASSGTAWIGYIATCKHPDFISHWRYGKWAWRMENLGRGGMWDVIDHCPNKENTIELDKCDQDLLRSWLPEPKEIGEWCATRDIG